MPKAKLTLLELKGCSAEVLARCHVVSVRVPGEESWCSCAQLYEKDGAAVRWLPPQEYDYCVAPLLPDWFAPSGHA